MSFYKMLCLLILVGATVLLSSCYTANGSEDDVGYGGIGGHGGGHGGGIGGGSGR